MATDVPPQVVVHSRYLVVRDGRTCREWDDSYQVVDTDTTGSGEGRVLCDHMSNADAGLIADALNRRPVAQLEQAMAAVVAAHLKLVELDRDPSASWGSFHPDEGVAVFVADLQRQYEQKRRYDEEPF